MFVDGKEGNSWIQLKTPVFSEEILADAHERLIGELFPDGAESTVSDSALNRLGASYTPTAPLRRYRGIGRTANGDRPEEIKLEVSARTPFEARYAIASSLSNDFELIAVGNASDTEKRDELLDNLNIPETVWEIPLPVKRKDLISFAHRRHQRSLAGWQIRESSIEKSLKYIEQTFSEESPKQKWTGFVVIDGEVTWVQVDTRGVFGAIAAATLQFGDHHPMAFFNSGATKLYLG